MTVTAETEAPWREVLERIHTFPTLPMIVHKVNELVSMPETSAKDIEAVVMKDQVLTGKLLRLVNSPFYGFPKEITTISRAVGIIGFDALRNLVFSTSVIRLFKSTGSPTFQPVEFWKHSIGTALAAKELGRRLGEKQVEEFFVGGLIHDIGKLIHDEYFGPDFRKACEAAAQRGILLREAEREIMHFTHDQSGGLLIKQWNLHPRLIAMVTSHHEPSKVLEYQREVGVIHLADILCRAKGMGSGGDNRIPLVDHPTWDRLGLTLGDIEQVMSRMDQDFGPATAFLIE